MISVALFNLLIRGFTGNPQLCIHFKNFEAVFPNMEEKCFNTTRFVDCKKGQCLSYANGKSVGRVKKGIKPPRYENESGYTFEGGQNYRETVISLPEEIVGNKPTKYFGHYKDKGLENPIMHIRYDTRFKPNGDKILMIHEFKESFLNLPLEDYILTFDDGL